MDKTETVFPVFCHQCHSVVVGGYLFGKKEDDLIVAGAHSPHKSFFSPQSGSCPGSGCQSFVVATSFASARV